MRDQMDEFFAVEAASEITKITNVEQNKEFEVKLTAGASRLLALWLLTQDVERRSIVTDVRFPESVPAESYQEHLGPTLLKKFACAFKIGEDTSEKLTLELSYREVLALALVSLDRDCEEQGLYGEKFWQALSAGQLDHTTTVAWGRGLYPSVLECIEAFVEAGGNDQYNLRGVFERLSNIGHQQEGAVG